MKYPGVTLLLTDGSKYLADQAKCYWLIDIIASHQHYPKLIAEPFRVWRIEVQPNHAALVWADDGNDVELARQNIPYTDFRLESFKLYAIQESGPGMLVVLLPGEY